MSDEPQSYDADTIRVLDAVQAVRMRPVMFFGSDPVNQLALDAIDVSIDAALRGSCSNIVVTLKPNTVICVEDNSEGLPVDINKHYGVPLLELLFTKTAVPGYFHQFMAPTVTGGLNGMDIQAQNAACEWLTVENRRDGYVWSQSYRQGYAQVPVTRGHALNVNEHTGLTITFRPDFTIFPPDCPPLDTSLLRERCREVAYTVAGLTITFRDERASEFTEQTFFTPDGLRSWLNDQPLANPLHEPIYINTDLYERYLLPRNMSDTNPRKVRHRSKYPFHAEIVIQFTSDAPNIEIGYSNTLQTTHGGDHMTGLRSGLVAGINRHLPIGQPPLRWKELPSGLRTAISIRHLHPQFESQTTMKLMNRDVHNPIKRAITRSIDSFAIAHPDQMQRIIDHCIANRRKSS